MKPARLSRQLRRGEGKFLQRRRGVVGLSLLSAGSMAVIGLYQVGILRHLPEPPLPGLDADRVDASAEAYSRFATPDAFLGLGNYAATAALAAMGGRDRARRSPLVPLAMSAKAVFDAGQAVRLFYQQWHRHRAFCSWCLLAAGASLAALPLTFPEAGRAWREMRKA